MAPIAEAEIDLFSAELPDFSGIKKLSDFVNSSEINQNAFAEQIKKKSKNDLAAGIGLFILGKNPEALEKLQKARDCKEKFMYLGLAFRKQKMFDDALKNIEKAGKKQADPLIIALEKVATLRMAGRFDEAAKELKACSNFEKVSAEYHFQLGKLNDAQGLYEQALENYTIAVELDGDHQQAFFQLAYTCDLRGNDDAAIDYYKQITKKTPVYINALLNLAVLCEDAGHYDKAAICVDVVLNSHPNHKKALLFSKDIESSKVMVYDEEKEKLLDRHFKTLEIPISDFELSVRSRNCLRKMNIYTLGDLLKITEAELLSYKNFGETSLVEIKKVMDQKGLSLGMALEDKSAALQAQAAGIEGVNEELTGKLVEDMELSVRARRALARLKIQTLGELINKTEAELLGCKNFGVTSLNEIKERLTSYGLGLRKLE